MGRIYRAIRYIRFVCGFAYIVHGFRKITISVIITTKKNSYKNMLIMSMIIFLRLIELFPGLLHSKAEFPIDRGGLLVSRTDSVLQLIGKSE